jgi:hypothetical protein
MIVSSNKTSSAWAEAFGDPVAVTAMVDRLVHHADGHRAQGRQLSPAGQGRVGADRQLAALAVTSFRPAIPVQVASGVDTWVGSGANLQSVLHWAWRAPVATTDIVRWSPWSKGRTSKNDDSHCRVPVNERRGSGRVADHTTSLREPVLACSQPRLAPASGDGSCLVTARFEDEFNRRP